MTQKGEAATSALANVPRSAVFFPIRAPRCFVTQRERARETSCTYRCLYVVEEKDAK